MPISYEPRLDRNQQTECAPSEDSDQPGHPPSLIRVFAVRMKKAWVLSYPLSAQRRLWSDWADAQADLSRLWSAWADAQADLSLRWAHTHFVGFVMSWLIWLRMIRTVNNFLKAEWFLFNFHQMFVNKIRSSEAIQSGGHWISLIVGRQRTVCTISHASLQSRNVKTI